MYCTHYGFKEKPFNITPNPRFIYLSKNHKEAFAHLLYGIENHTGFIELTGEVGTGKTTVLRTILEQLDDESHCSALILNPCLSSIELLRNINREFAIPHEGLENGSLLEELNRFLMAENRAGRTVVLVIDEAQNLAPEVLEQIRLISNLETESDKLIQIVLAGQPELKTLLNRTELRQLSQRITVRFHLLPMDLEDSCIYIRHRLEVAGGGAWISFPEPALKKIYRFSKGSPRLINIVCDRALLVGYGENTQQIDTNIVSKALAELRQAASPGWRPALRKILHAGILLSAGLFIVWGLLATWRAMSHRPGPPMTAATGNVGSSRDFDPKTAPAAKPPAAKPATPVAKIPTPAPAAVPLNNNPAVPAPSPLTFLPAGPGIAFNAVASLWLPNYASTNGTSIKKLAADHGFSLTPMHASLQKLQSLDLPAILELQLPGTGTRYLALTGFKGEQLIISPSLPNGLLLSRTELNRYWKGQAYLLWRNHQKIPSTLADQTAGAEVIKLQVLLAGAGVLGGELSGIYDDATKSALKSFQKSHSLKADGLPNDLTLLFLYRDGGKFAAPRLQQGSLKRGNS
jgi:general secretion pathway protein A